MLIVGDVRILGRVVLRSRWCIGIFHEEVVSLVHGETVVEMRRILVLRHGHVVWPIIRRIMASSSRSLLMLLRHVEGICWCHWRWSL